MIFSESLLRLFFCRETFRTFFIYLRNINKLNKLSPQTETLPALIRLHLICFYLR